MKLKSVLMMAMVALVMTNCSQEEDAPQTLQGEITEFTADVEGQSRSTMTDAGVFSWVEGDKISVWDGSSFKQFTNEGGNTFKGDKITPSGYAVYPAGSHSYSNGTITVNLPDSYGSTSTVYVKNTNAVMVASVSGSNLTFNHVGGVMRFNVKDVPVGAYEFVFTANDKDITGNFTVSNQVITASTKSSKNSVSIKFKALTSTQDMTFYVPVPTGTYTGYKVEIKGSNTIALESPSAVNTINRKTLLLMPMLTCTHTGLVKGDNAFTLENAEQDMNVGGNENLLIETPATSTNAQLNLNYAPETNNSTLNISDGQTGASTDSKAKVVVNVSSSNKVSELNIDAPTLTVELASGTYDEITAKTAKQTLIIKKGVTVKELKVIGGQVVIESGANVQKQTELRVLTFEDEDAKFEPYYLDYADDWAGREITTWSDLIDDPQYGGPLTYADMMSAMYTWYDEGNTELAHTFPDNYSYCYWGGGHAISNYWGAGYSNEDRDKHIAKYYGEDYVANNAGNDSMLGWFNLQFMTPVPAHSGNNFAVHYGYKDFFTYVENLPEIRFEDGEARVIDHMYVCNTNYTLNQLVCGVMSEAGNTFGGSWTGLNDDAWLKIVAQGFDDVDADAYAEPISEVEFYLVKGQNVVESWQKWDLSGLGAVAKVRFNFHYSDDMGGKYGFTIPGYFAYDDVAVRFEK